MGNSSWQSTLLLRQEILNKLADYYTLHGHCQSVRELADDVGVSDFKIKWHLDRLEHEGYVERERLPSGRAAARTVKLTAKGLVGYGSCERE